MVRLVLISVALMLLASEAHAQRDSRVEAYEQLAREMEENDWKGALVASRGVLHLQGDTSDLHGTVECMHAWMMEMQLQEHLAATPSDFGAVSRELRSMANTLDELVESHESCGPEPARRRELAYLQPRVEHAAQLSAGARDRGEASAELEQVFIDEHRQIVEAIEPGPVDAWERVRRAWAAERPPEAQPREWPARSQAPMIGTGVLFVGFGLVSFFSTLTVFSGRGLPSLSAGGWGITFALGPAIISGATWEKSTRALLIASLSLTAIAAGGGVAAIARLDRDGRYFGRGLLIGSALSVMWQIGGWLHYTHPERSQREWRDRIRVSPSAGRGFGGLTASGTF